MKFGRLFVGDFCSPNNKIDIEFRCNSPVSEEEDMLMGHAYWNGEELISKDGDNYYLNDFVYAYEWLNDLYLTVWIEVKWNNDC